MIFVNNIARPGDIKRVEVSPVAVEVSLHDGKRIRYVKAEETVAKYPSHTQPAAGEVNKR